MTKCSKRNLFLSVATLFVLATPGAAIAGGKGGSGGGNHAGNTKPSENMSLNYGKTEHTYTQQTASKKTGTTKVKKQPYIRYELKDVGVSSYQ
jgi:type VI protein secretion system component Hcp